MSCSGLCFLPFIESLLAHQGARISHTTWTRFRGAGQQNCWDLLSEADIERLQDDLGLNFPKEYTQYLLRFNAGDWMREVWCRLVDRGASWDEVHIETNFGIVSDSRFSFYDIRHLCEAYEERISTDWVPVMGVLGGGMVCINCGTANFGRVTLWDNQLDENNEFLTYPLAADFAAFMNSLMPVDDSEFHREQLPTFQAVERGDRFAVRDYLDDGGKVELRNDSGQTLLMCAARSSWPKIVAMLLEAGADPNARDSDGCSALYHTIFGSSLDSAKLLVSARSDVHFRDAGGRDLAEISKEEHCHRIRYFFEKCLPEENH